MKGIILAAGIGNRLKALAKDKPKALISIAGRPMIEYVIRNFQNSNIKKLGIVIRPQDKHKFKALAKRLRLGLDADFFFQEKPEGRLKALEEVKDFIADDTFILSWCDTITPFKFSKIIEAHQRYKPIATLCISKPR